MLSAGSASRNWLPVVALLSASLWPMADVVAGNGVSSIPTDRALLWGVGIFGFCVAAAWLLARLVNDFARAASVVSVLVIAFFCYGTVEKLLGKILSLMHFPHGRATFFLVLFILIAYGAYRSSRYAEVRRSLMIGSVLFFLSSLALCFWQGAFSASRKVNADVDTRISHRVNVYHFLFDGLARPDILRDRAGVHFSDPRPLWSSRGFVFSPNVRASFPSTLRSVGAVFNRGRPTGVSEKLEIDNSSVVRTFRRNGYHYARYGEVFVAFSCSGREDICLSASSGLSEFDTIMVARTPFYPFLQSRLLSGTASVELRHNLLKISGSRYPRPTFLFSYMVPPHPPYIFSRSCQADPAFGGYRSWGKGAAEKYGWAYDCVNRFALEAIDKIIRADPTALIIVSGDHGTMFSRKGKGEDSWTPTVLEERLPTFLAVRAPDRCKADLGHLKNLIDLYPAIFRCLA